jgi:Ca2+-binding RTX toxin-like protein
LATLALIDVAATGSPIGPLADLLGSLRAQVITGSDTDNLSNPLIQPANVAANQSLNNTDIIEGGLGNDVLIGLLGSDVMLGGFGRDIIVGGPDPGAPNSDIMFGGPGDDINLWAPGDGSEAFFGDAGRDALVFGVSDRANGVPILSDAVPGYPFGVPTANVTGQGGFCRIEAAPADSGFDFLVRFFARATGNLAVTVRTRDVEQVFCTSEEGGAITYADLTQASPTFAVVAHSEVVELNATVGRMIR